MSSDASNKLKLGKDINANLSKSKVEAPTVIRKHSESDSGYTIRKKTFIGREKPSIDSDEQELGMKRKIIKVDQDEAKNISEAPPIEICKVSTSIPKPPEDSRVAIRRENIMHTGRDLPEKPFHTSISLNWNQESMKRFPPSQYQLPSQLEQKHSIEEPFEVGVFSDYESNPVPTKQSAIDSGHSQNSIKPNFHQQSHMQQSQIMREPAQHSHYQYQQNPEFPPQQHFQGLPQNTQLQYSRPYFQNTESVQDYPLLNQFQQTFQLQPLQQAHHSQTHPPGPSHFPSQPQFPNEHDLGPANKYQTRLFNLQQQHHGYNQFQIPFQSQEPPQSQFMTPDQQMNTSTMNPQFTEQARRPGLESIGPPQDFNPDLDPLGTARKDFFPGSRNFKQTFEMQFYGYDQGNALVFKSLLQGIRRELPGSIKVKYEHKLGRMVSLSEMVEMIVKRDFNAVESLYEHLPYRCSSCGMRFSNRIPLDKHLDNHLRFNMEQKEKTKTRNLREQLITTEHWIKDEGHINCKAANIENGEDSVALENYVPTSEDQKSCKACGEAFKEVWDKDKETWLLDTATKVKYKEEASDEANEVSYDLMHFRCYKLCLQIESK